MNISRHVLTIKPGEKSMLTMTLSLWLWHHHTYYCDRSIFSLSFQRSATSNVEKLVLPPNHILSHVCLSFVSSARNTKQKFHAMRRKNLWERKNFCVTSFMTILITCWHSLRFPPGVLSKREIFAVSIFGTFSVLTNWRVQWKFN